jgi:hypothetical protein
MESKNKPASQANAVAIIETIEDLQARRDRLEAEHAAELDEIRKKQEALSAITSPFHRQLEVRRLLRARIAGAQQERAAHVDRVAELENNLDGVFGNLDGPNASLNLRDAFEGPWKHLLPSEHLIASLDRWLERKKRELAKLESEILKYADEHELRYLLPPDFAK